MKQSPVLRRRDRPHFFETFSQGGISVPLFYPEPPAFLSQGETQILPQEA